MSESTFEDRVRSEADQKEIERLTEMTEQAKKSLVLCLNGMAQVIEYLTGRKGKLTMDQVRLLCIQIAANNNLAIALSPWKDFSDVKTETFNCRACGKVVWEDGSQVRYCHNCIRSTGTPVNQEEEPPPI